MRPLYLAFLLTGCGAMLGAPEEPETPRECDSGFSCMNAHQTERACDVFHYGKACLSLAYDFANGEGVAKQKKDMKRAMAIYDRTCEQSEDLDKEHACLFSAVHREKGDAEGAAAPWFEKACRANASAADLAPCAKGAAAIADEAQADVLWKKGCDHREHESCMKHAKVLAGAGKRKEATDIYSSVCFFKKDQDACAAAADTTDDPNEKKYRSEDACKLGRSESCAYVAALKKEADRKWDEEQKKRDADWEKAREEEWKKRDEEARKHPTSSSSSSITMSDATVNGLHIKSLSCTGVSNVFVGTLGITAMLGDRASAIRACGVKGPIHVAWSSDGKSIQSVKTTPANACLATALQSMKTATTGSCSADID